MTSRDNRFSAVLLMIGYHDEGRFTQTQLAEIAKAAFLRLTPNVMQGLIDQQTKYLETRKANLTTERD